MNIILPNNYKMSIRYVHRIAVHKLHLAVSQIPASSTRELWKPFVNVTTQYSARYFNNQKMVSFSLFVCVFLFKMEI